MVKKFVLNTGETVYINPRFIESFKVLSDSMVSLQYSGQLGSIQVQASEEEMLKLLEPRETPLLGLVKALIPVLVIHMVRNGAPADIFDIRKDDLESPDTDQSDNGPKSDSE
jgi:hypothetical protein